MLASRCLQHLANHERHERHENFSIRVNNFPQAPDKRSQRQSTCRYRLANLIVTVVERVHLVSTSFEMLDCCWFFGTQVLKNQNIPDFCPVAWFASTSIHSTTRGR